MISALVPVRNGSATLSIALASLRSQSIPLTECLVIDDGSTDSTPNILDEWSREWPALKVVRTSGIGIASALNLGLERASQEWIARLDADDQCAGDRFEVQLATAAATPNAALIGCEVRDDAGAHAQGMKRHVVWANSVHSHEHMEKALWIDSPLPHPSWLVHRRAFQLVGSYDDGVDLPEDYEWLHRFFCIARREASLRAVKSRKPLVVWADSPHRLTRVSSAYSEQAFNAVKARYLALLLSERDELDRPVFLHGFGPKAKRLLPFLRKHSLRLRAAVDVHPRRAGTSYKHLEIWDVTRFTNVVGACEPFVIICLGQPEARENCEQFCTSLGLSPKRDFLSL